MFFTQERFLAGRGLAAFHVRVCGAGSWKSFREPVSGSRHSVCLSVCLSVCRAVGSSSASAWFRRVARTAGRTGRTYVHTYELSDVVEQQQQQQQQKRSARRRWRVGRGKRPVIISPSRRMSLRPVSFSLYARERTCFFSRRPFALYTRGETYCFDVYARISAPWNF